MRTLAAGRVIPVKNSRRCSSSADRFDLDQVVRGFSAAVIDHLAPVAGMAVWDEDLRVVKRCPLEAHPLVRQRLQKRHQRPLLVGGEPQWANEVPDVVPVLLRKIVAPVVELHHLLQRRDAAVVEIRCGQLDVAQPGDLPQFGAS